MALVEIWLKSSEGLSSETRGKHFMMPALAITTWAVLVCLEFTFLREVCSYRCVS